MTDNKKAIKNDSCNKGSKKTHTVNNATVNVEAPEPKQARTDYAHCAVTEMLQDGNTIFSITPKSKKKYKNNRRIFLAEDMKVHTRRNGHYVISLEIQPDRDRDRVEELSALFLDALRCTFAHDKKRKEAKQ